MCYSYAPEYSELTPQLLHAQEEFRRLQDLGFITPTRSGYHYPKDTVAVILRGGEVRPMRWDLIPRNFLAPLKLTLPEVVKKKSSRAKNPETGRAWGYDAYNARLETVVGRPAFRAAWSEGRRAIIAANSWRERPNMDGAPPEFKGKEYQVFLPEPMFFAALWDTYQAVDGAAIESCTIITGPSDEIPELQGIYHERTPIVLGEEAAEIWLNPEVSPGAAYHLLKGVESPVLRVEEVAKDASNTTKPSL